MRNFLFVFVFVIFSLGVPLSIYGQRAKCEKGLNQIKEQVVTFINTYTKDEAEKKKKISEVSAWYEKKKGEFLDACEKLPADAIACVENYKEKRKDDKCNSIFWKLRVTYFIDLTTSIIDKAAHGTWTGDYGTITFNPDGTGVVKMWTCGYSLKGIGIVKIEKDCGEPNEWHGHMRLRETGFALFDKSGDGHGFGAYVDRQGNLHANEGGRLLRLDKNRKGTIHTWGQAYNVNGDTCTPVDKNSKTKYKCGWVNKGGKKIFWYEYPDPFDKTKKRQSWYVWVEDQGLLVPPHIEGMVFRR